jgi:hypothetical protein
MNKNIDKDKFLDYFRVYWKSKFHECDGDYPTIIGTGVYRNRTHIRYDIIRDIKICLALIPDSRIGTKIKKVFDNPTCLDSDFLSTIIAIIDPSFNYTKVICKVDRKLTHTYIEKYGSICDLALNINTDTNCYSDMFEVASVLPIFELKEMLSLCPDTILKYLFNEKKLKQMAHEEKIKKLETIINELEKSALEKEEITKVKREDATRDSAYLRAFLTNQRYSKAVGTYEILCHPNIPDKVFNEITETISNLDKFLYHSSRLFHKKHYNYYENSLHNCYFLSTVFSLYDSSWKLVQGKSIHSGIGKHSWLEKNGICYDPALRIITSSKLYYEFFNIVKSYSKKEIIECMSKHHNTFDYFPEPEFPGSSGNKEFVKLILKTLEDTTKPDFKDAHLKKFIKYKNSNKVSPFSS